VNAEFLEAYLADELDAASRRQVEEALRRDEALRKSFVQQARLDCVLRVLLAAEESLPADLIAEGCGGQNSPQRERNRADGALEAGGVASQGTFEEAVMARLRSEGGGDSRRFAKSVLTEIVQERERVHPLRWPDFVKAGMIAAAASLALLFVLHGIVVPTPEPQPPQAATESVAPFVARIESGREALWSPATQERLHAGGWLTRGPLHLDGGEVLVALNSGATVLVSGPARFSIESSNRLFLESGELSAEVPSAATGFTVNTPRLNAVDIGTRFGVRVEENGDSELHVMEGAVEASRASGHSAPVLVREGLALRADARVRNELTPVPYAGDGFRLQSGPLSAPQPLLHFDFDETGGAVLEDRGVGRLHDVSLVAQGELDRAPRRGTGRFGGGLVFQAGHSLEVPLTHDLRVEGPFTLSFWVKIPPKFEERRDAVLMEFGRGENAWRLLCHHRSGQGSGGALRLEHAGGYLAGQTDIADGNWHHVVCRFIGGEGADLASHLHLFIDGQLESSSEARGLPVGSGPAGMLRLGHPGAEGLKGWIDEVQLFNEAIPTPVLQALGSKGG